MKQTHEVVCPQERLVRVQGSGSRVQGSGFRGQGSGFRVQGSGFRVQISGRVLEEARETGKALKKELCPPKPLTLNPKP